MHIDQSWKSGVYFSGLTYPCANVVVCVPPVRHRSVFSVSLVYFPGLMLRRYFRTSVFSMDPRWKENLLAAAAIRVVRSFLVVEDMILHYSWFSTFMSVGVSSELLISLLCVLRQDMDLDSASE